MIIVIWFFIWFLFFVVAENSTFDITTPRNDSVKYMKQPFHKGTFDSSASLCR
jgi:hypothetical protein